MALSIYRVRLHSEAHSEYTVPRDFRQNLFRIGCLNLQYRQELRRRSSFKLSRGAKCNCFGTLEENSRLMRRGLHLLDSKEYSESQVSELAAVIATKN